MAFVYFIENTENNSIKIGYTAKSVKSRLSQLQTGSSARLEVIKVINGDLSLETALHRKFSEYRLNGEWFSKEIKSKLDEINIEDYKTENNNDEKNSFSFKNILDILMRPRYEPENKYIESVWLKLAEENNLSVNEYFQNRLKEKGDIVLNEAYTDNLSIHDFKCLVEYHKKVCRCLENPVTPFDIFCDKENTEKQEMWYLRKNTFLQMSLKLNLTIYILILRKANNSKIYHDQLLEFYELMSLKTDIEILEKKLIV